MDTLEALQGLQLRPALEPREWAAMRVLAAAVALHEIRTGSTGTPSQWMAGHDELWKATAAFVAALGEP